MTCERWVSKKFLEMRDLAMMSEGAISGAAAVQASYLTKAGLIATNRFAYLLFRGGPSNRPNAAWTKGVMPTSVKRPLILHIRGDKMIRLRKPRTD